MHLSDTHEDIVLHLHEVEVQWRRLGEVWAGQIALARQQMDTAIFDLTREFADIVDNLSVLAALARDLENDETRLAQATQAAPGATDGDVVEELEKTATRLELKAAAIRANVESSLIHLQFQDRVNQILGHVEANIGALPDALATIRDTFQTTGRLTPPDFSPLLAAIAASYTTREERALHQGQSVDDGDELTFF